MGAMSPAPALSGHLLCRKVAPWFEIVLCKILHRQICLSPGNAFLSAPIKKEDHKQCAFSWDDNNAHYILPQGRLHSCPVSQYGPQDPLVWRCTAHHLGPAMRTSWSRHG